jgi:hypothetical protein
MAHGEIPLVFVVGTGRCGTHTLWKLFESVPNTLSMHEGNGTVRHGPAALVGKRFALGSMPELNGYLYHYGGEAAFARTFAPDAAMTSLMDGCFAGRGSAIAWCAQHGIAYCDANPFAFNFINYLHGKFPHAKFIHLVRDGYACVRSWSRRDASTYPDDVPHTPAAISWLLAKPLPFPSDPAHREWQHFDRVQRISWFWNAVNANIALRLERIPAENRRVMKIEEVSQASAADILEFCGLPREFAPESLAPDDPSEGPAIEWTPENLSRFNALAAPMMTKLGYPLR